MHHASPASLRGDDAILNCCLFFTQGIKTPLDVGRFAWPSGVEGPLECGVGGDDAGRGGSCAWLVCGREARLRC